MTPVTLSALCKQFGSTLAVDHLDLTIDAGSLFFLLGPSGCGKTTLLRMLAGLTMPSSGTIRFGDQDVTALAAEKRQCGMCFQGYALWPHMSVAANVAFGLEMAQVPADERHRRVSDMLELVQMTPYADRKPNELSGGQQQRVALARALVMRPRLLLLDEPLSNLDAKLRLDMRKQIGAICRQARTTAVYVTHDQSEALSMADGIALLQGGKLVQAGSPRELYDRPASRFVADFLGQTNFLDAAVLQVQNGLARLQTSAGVLVSAALPASLTAGMKVTCSIRPQAISLADGTTPGASDRNVFPARWLESTFLGETAQHQLQLADGSLLRALELNPASGSSDRGREVSLAVAHRDVVVLTK